MGGYKKKTNRGIKDVAALLAAIKEVKVGKRKLYEVAAAYGIVYNSFKRYVKRFDNKVPDFSKANEDELLLVAKEISSFGAPTVRF